MPKQKKNQSLLIKSLEELISDFDRPKLVNALAMLEHDLSWQILRAALMKEYMSKIPAALDNASRTGRQIEAAYEAGVAQALYDTANSIIEKYKDVLATKVNVVVGERPEE